MKKLISKFIFFCFLFCLLLSETAIAASRAYLQKKCRETMKNNPPEILINYNYGELSYNHDLSAEEIKQLFRKKNKFQEDTIYYGLTLLNFYQSFDIEYHKEERENGDFMCVFPRKIKIFVGFADPTIYLNKTLEDDSCLQQKTLRHELNHLDNAHTFLKALVLALKANISQIIMDTGPVFDENSNVYFSQIKSFTDVYNEKWKKNDALLDNYENYHKEAKICH